MSCFLKVPQAIITRPLRKAGVSDENETYLNPQIFTEQFYKPASEILGSTLTCFVFEQEYHPKKDRFEVKRLTKDLDIFLSVIPQDTRYHIKLRFFTLSCQSLIA